MSRDPRVGLHRAMLRCEPSQVRGIRRSWPPTGRGPSGLSEKARERERRRQAGKLVERVS